MSGGWARSGLVRCALMSATEPGAVHEHTSVVTPRGPLDLARTLGVVGRGPSDPCVRVGRSGAALATRTASGPATLVFTPAEGVVHVRAFGAGAREAIARAPGLLGQADDPETFSTAHPVVSALASRVRGLRLTAGANPVELAMRAVVEQRVTTQEATRTWSALVRRFGEPAPGPVAGLWLPPDPAVVAGLPVWDFRRVGLEHRRAVTLRMVAAEAPALLASAHDVERTCRRLATIPGIGPWTLSLVRHVAYGDPSAVLIGDWHVGRDVVFALTGEMRGDDRMMAALLAEFPGHEARVWRLISAAGIHHPRRAPGRPVNDVLRSEAARSTGTPRRSRSGYSAGPRPGRW